ncbi:DoxX family protein [Flavobacteriaceae bacterium]|nr:DoxX family protein [Flavobacteriaceae bacterium]
METISILSQLIVSISVIIVWVFRYENIVLEFKQYGLSSLVRNAVGASKIALATVLILGIWYTEFLIPAALLMAVLMIGAQYCHMKVKNPLVKFIPSLALLLLCLFVAAFNYGLI